MGFDLLVACVFFVVLIYFSVEVVVVQIGLESDKDKSMLNVRVAISK